MRSEQRQSVRIPDPREITEGTPRSVGAEELPGPRHELRQQWRRGEIDKHVYSRRLAILNQDLAEYSSFLRETSIAAITVTPVGVELTSAWAPVRFASDLNDVGTPPVVSLGLGQYEALEMRTLLALLEDASTFVDLGSNIGWYAVHAAALRRDLNVVALEPVSHTYEQLRRNLELNDAQVTALRLGLSQAPGQVDITVSPTLSGAASMAPSRHYADQVVETVEMTTLDALTDEMDLRVDVLKADVEGAELLVLQGGIETLRRDKPAVLAEMLRIHSAEFGYHPNEILDLMRPLGYRCFASTPDGWIPFESMDETTVETNFLFLHEDRHAAIEPHLRTLRDDRPAV